MYQILATNIETLKERKLQSKDSEISVAVKTSDLEKGITKLYAFRYGMIYNPENEFKPNVVPNHKLSESHIEEYRKLLPEAYQALAKAQQRYNQPTSGGNSGELEKRLENAKRILDEKDSIIAEKERIIASHVAAKRTTTPEIDMLKTLEKLVGQAKEMQPQVHVIRFNDKEVKIEGAIHESYTKILTYIKMKRAVYLYGPAGTGKSHICEQVAKALGLDYYFSNAIMQEFKVTGYEDANGNFHETAFYQAFTRGGLFFLDEMDSSVPEALLTLNAALAQGHFDFPTGREKAHPNFRVIAAGNTVGGGADLEYTGRYSLDKSTLDRFIFIPIGYSPTIETALANGDTDLLDFIRDVRQTAEKNELKLLVTYRALINIRDMGELLPLHEVIDECLIKGMDKEDVRYLIRNMSITSGNKYLSALRKIA